MYILKRRLPDHTRRYRFAETRLPTGRGRRNRQTDGRARQFMGGAARMILWPIVQFAIQCQGAASAHESTPQSARGLNEPAVATMQEAALPHEWQTPDGIVDAFALCATREDAGR